MLQRSESTTMLMVRTSSAACVPPSGSIALSAAHCTYLALNRNAAASFKRRSLRFITKNTNIPVPKLYGCFEDDGAVYLITEYIDGVNMADLTPEQRKVVEVELEGYIATLRSLKSEVWGGPSGHVSFSTLGPPFPPFPPFPAFTNMYTKVIPPYRVLQHPVRVKWAMKPREVKDLVFCHNDLSTYNVIVDPETLKVKAVIDWEYAGFYPQDFEAMFFRRLGPSVALDGEIDDEERLLKVMYENELKE